jgi:hypothetical protein
METPRLQPVHAPSWNAEEIDELCGLVSLSTPFRDIARRFGRSQEDVRAKARTLGRVA